MALDHGRLDRCRAGGSAVDDVGEERSKDFAARRLERGMSTREPSSRVSFFISLRADLPGILAIEDKPISHPFFAKGINMCIDGQDTDVIKHCLSNDISLTIQHQNQGANMFTSTGEVAPAMGMIGTLIGLVQMLSSMEDPKTIGPAMAVALLTTLYGAVMANAFAIPIAEKLKLRSREESLNKKLILESIQGIQTGTHPKVLEQLLINYLPQNKRDAYAKVD